MTGADGGYFLASDADRDQVIDALRAAFAQGRLTEEELGTRINEALGGRTYAQLAAVTADLPARPAVARPPGGPAQDQADRIAGIWGLAAFAGLPSALLVLAFLTRSGALAVAGFVLFCLDLLVAFMGGMVAIGTVIDSRMKSRRARGQLPPRPG